MEKDIIVDLETLGTTESAVVISIGAVRFDINNLDAEPHTFYRVLRFDEQENVGRTTDPGTLEWWALQSEAARKVFAEQRHSVRGVLYDFDEFAEDAHRIWGYGSTFDNIILRSLYRSFGMGYPVAYGGDMCLRTIKFLTGGIEIQRTINLVHHNALDDAIYEFQTLKQWLEFLRGCGAPTVYGAKT